jgi:hypothetical protein
VISGTSSAPSHVYPAGMAAPSSHGPMNWSGEASAAADAGVVEAGDWAARADDVVVDPDEVVVVVVIEVVVEVAGIVDVVTGMNSVGGGATVVDVVVVVLDSSNRA